MDIIFEKYYNELKPIVHNINQCICKFCGGTFKNCCCDYCEQKDNDLEIDITKLELLLENFIKEAKDLNKSNIRMNKFFNLLYILNDKVDCVNNFLNKYNYQSYFEEYAQELIPRLNNNLSELDINTLETIIYQKNNQYNLNNIYKTCINKCINKEKNIDLNCFQEVIKQLTEQTLKPFYRNSTCILKKYEKIENNGKHFIISGENGGNKIYLNIDEINDMYYNQNLIILITLFHEATHGLQHKNIFYDNKNIDPLTILEIKDHILSKHLPNYYQENYNNITSEIEADFYGYQLASQYIDINIMDQEIINKYNNILNQKRTINGQEQDIDTIFNIFIKDHPELLKKHPQLEYIYKIDNNQVIPLNEEELYLKYQSLTTSENITDEQIAKYNLLYSQYIDINKRLQNPKL